MCINMIRIKQKRRGLTRLSLATILFFGLMTAMYIGCSGGGDSAPGVHPPSPLPPNHSTQITQFGITWTFDGEYQTGQFANGDYWVVGPVSIISITPESRNVSGRTMNGSMINPSPRDGNRQGYDSAMSATVYDANVNAARPHSQNLSAANPLFVPVHSSLISTVSIAAAQSRPQI